MSPQINFNVAILLIDILVFYVLLFLYLPCALPAVYIRFTFRSSNLVECLYTVQILICHKLPYSNKLFDLFGVLGFPYWLLFSVPDARTTSLFTFWVS